jgi:thiol:disulfide interchange protein DsbA
MSHTGMKKWLLLILWVPSIVFAAEFKEGTDYQIISQTPITNTKQVPVTEFFSYGCPWCYKIEPELHKWVVKNKDSIKFDRIPVIFERSWDVYAKAYYTAKSLGIADKMTPAIFKAVQDEKKKLSSNKAMIAFFTEHGANQEVVQSAFESSPAIDGMLKNGVRLMQTYKVYSVPTVIVAGHFKTDLMMAKGDIKKMLQILDYLVVQSKKAL